MAGIGESPLPKVHRFITDHNAEGQAVFNTTLGEDMPWQDIKIAKFGLGYTTNQFPVDMNRGQDIHTYSKFMADPPGIAVKNGTVVRFVDVPPNSLSPMHRTVSLDYGVVLEGEMELILDSGEKRIMKRGDISVQRGTMHAWRNTSTTSWGRMMYVLVDSKRIDVAGKALAEDYGSGMPGTKPSGN